MLIVEFEVSNDNLTFLGFTLGFILGFILGVIFSIIISIIRCDTIVKLVSQFTSFYPPQCSLDVTTTQECPHLNKP